MNPTQETSAANIRIGVNSAKKSAAQTITLLALCVLMALIEARASDNNSSPNADTTLVALKARPGCNGANEMERRTGEVGLRRLGALDFVGYGSKEEMNAIGWWINCWGNSHVQTLILSLSTMPAGSTWEQTELDPTQVTKYAELVAAELEKFPKNKQLILRINWEPNGNWYPWSVREKKYANSYRRHWREIATTIKAKLDINVLFDWSLNALQTPGVVDPVEYYPGDDLVDIVSIDVYNFKRSSSEQADIDTLKSDNLGLKWLVGFAKARGKKYALAEFGVGESEKVGGSWGDSEEFMCAVLEWVVSEKPLYVGYWDDSSGFDSSLRKHPNASRLLIEYIEKRELPRRCMINSFGAGQ